MAMLNYATVTITTTVRIAIMATASPNSTDLLLVKNMWGVTMVQVTA